MLHQLNADKNFLGHPNSHDPPHDTLFCVDVDETFVDAQFPFIPGGGSFTARGFAHRHPEPFGGQGDRACHFHSSFLGDGLQFSTHFFKLLIVSAGQFDPCLPHHRHRFPLSVAFIHSPRF